jgi:hypothetical protein
MNIDNAFPSSYLKASELPDEGIVVTIQSIAMETIGEDEKPVIYFAEEDLTGGKSLVLNKTNAGTISEVLRTPETDEWIGKRIAIFPTETDYQGKRVACIRVRLRTPGQTQPNQTTRRPSARPMVGATEIRRDRNSPPPEAPPRDDDVPF